jgi:hypothetical protein
VSDNGTDIGGILTQDPRELATMHTLSRGACSTLCAERALMLTHRAGRQAAHEALRGSVR